MEHSDSYNEEGFSEEGLYEGNCFNPYEDCLDSEEEEIEDYEQGLEKPETIDRIQEDIEFRKENNPDLDFSDLEDCKDCEDFETCTTLCDKVSNEMYNNTYFRNEIIIDDNHKGEDYNHNDSLSLLSHNSNLNLKEMYVQKNEDLYFNKYALNKILKPKHNENELTEKQKEVVVHFLRDKLTQDKIGQELGISQQAVYSRLNLAKKKIDRELKRQDILEKIGTLFIWNSNKMYPAKDKEDNVIKTKVFTQEEIDKEKL